VSTASFVPSAGAVIRYWRTRGPAPVLLIQGVGVIGEGWRPQIDGLAPRHGLIWFDNRGIGESSIAGGTLSIEAMAADALAVLDAEGIERCHVVGHSMGGVIAQQIALQAPARVRSLSLLCTFHRGADAVRPTAGLIWLGLRSRVGTSAMRRQAFLELILPPDYLKRCDRAELTLRLARLFGHDLAHQPPIATGQLRALARYDGSARLVQLAGIPTLVVSAALDHIAGPRTGRALGAAIPGARYVEVPDAGHAAPIHAAVEINTLLEEHLARAESGENASGSSSSGVEWCAPQDSNLRPTDS
jgi:aminoacrylate hydrolase